MTCLLRPLSAPVSGSLPAPLVCDAVTFGVSGRSADRISDGSLQKVTTRWSTTRDIRLRGYRCAVESSCGAQNWPIGCCAHPVGNSHSCVMEVIARFQDQAHWAEMSGSGIPSGR